MTAPELARLTLTQPDRAMAALRGLDLPMATRWALLALAVSLSALLVGILVYLFPAPAPAPGDNPVAAMSEAVARQPMLMAAMQFVGVTIFAALAYQVGRLFGGTGSFADCLLVVTWIELLLVAAEAVQLALMLVLPPAVPILTSLTFGLMIYLFVRMIAAVHGFQRPLLVALGMFGTLIVASMILGLFIGPDKFAALAPQAAP